MSQTRRVWLAIVAGVGAVILFLLEAVLAQGLRGQFDQADPRLQAGFVVACGLGLLVGGPFWMRWENRDRVASGREKSYGLLEYAIIAIAGLVFTGAGVWMLVG
ncbi:MAG: hypothetical protein U0871_25970 [Gemmataceae bacterium]